MLVRLILAFVFVVGSTSVCVAAPSSQPTSAPSTRTAAVKPRSTPAVPSMVLLQIQRNGQMKLNQGDLAFPQLVQRIGGWKKHNVRVLLETEAGAPAARVLVVKTLMKEYKLSWFEKVTGAPKAAPVQAPAVRKTAQPKSVPVPVARVVPPAPRRLPLLPWSSVPMKAQATKNASEVVEIRGLLWSNGGPLQSSLATALVRYIGKQRTALGHLQSNKRGQFRYKLSPDIGATYRISVLQGNKLMEFPAPLEQQQSGVLYLRVTLRGSKPVPTRTTKVAPAPRRPAVQKPAKLRNPHVRTKPSARATVSPKAGPCQWDKLPLANMKGVTPKTGVEMRVQLLFPPMVKREALATGLLVNKGKKRTPVSRARTDELGCVRYLVKEEKGARYEVALLIGARLSVHPLPQIKAGARVVFGTVKLPNAKARSTLVEQLSVIVEQLREEEVRVAHVVQLFYQPTASSKSEAVYLPVAVGGKNVNLERNAKGASWKQDKLGLRLTGSLQPGSHRFLYSFTLPLNDGKALWRLVAAQPVAGLSVFFGRGLKPGVDAKLKDVELGNPGQKQKFRLMRLSGMKKGQEIRVPVVSKIKPGKGLLAWIKRWRGLPNKKNKLVGLSVLLGISLLGLFWIFATPRRKSEGADA
ncbi:MAG: hypothetical protein EP343_06865 [Deltaproteobacteria bacterium]|nr:MAG: hypothetical protein EP343_06865 [Deltaproteobacteria bacterium]